jgi:hypothetical protein
LTESDDHQPDQPDPGRSPANPWDQPPITEHPATEYPTTEYPTTEHPVGEQPAAEYPPGFPPPTGYLPTAGYPASEYPNTGYPDPNAGYPQSGYPNAGYPQPGYPQPGYSTQPYPVVGQPAPPPARRGRLGWILGAAVAVLLLLVGGGAVAAYQVLNGGGTQPDQVVPADTMAFAKLDLNPSASQKIAAARFLHRIPKLGSGFVGSGDWRQAMFQALASDGSIPSGVNYDRDVKSWLGKRAAVAVLPTLKDGDPEVLLVFQSTDDAKARAGIARFGSDNGVSFYRGYAVVAETQQIADQAVNSAKAANLSGSTHYQADLKQLGSLGVASGWTDLGAIAKLAASGSGSGAPSSKLLGSGRLAFTVRMTSNSADLIGKFYGLSGPASVAAPDLGSLPATSAIAVGAGVNGAAIDQMWNQYRELVGQFAEFSNPDQLQPGSPDDALDSLQQQFGVRLPDDLKTLLGGGISVSVDAHGLAGDSTPKFAVQTATDGAAAVKVMDNIRHAMENGGADFPVSYRATATGLLVASDPDYLAAINAGNSPKLSDVSSFRQALPDRAGATETAFVNLDAIAAELRAQGQSSDDLKMLEAFSAVGLTAKVQGGTATLRIRLIAH